MTKRGLLIAIEGADRSGKSTQIELIRSKIVGSQVLKFPDRTTATGKIINEYLQMKQQQDDHAIHLLFSANRWEAMPRMRQLLSQGTTLVLDRYCYSGVAYSAAKGLDWNWCAQPDIGLLKPDVVFYLNIDPSLAAARGKYGEERYENLEMQTKVRNLFLKMQDESWHIIDATQSIDQVNAQIMSCIERLQVDELNEIVSI